MKLSKVALAILGLVLCFVSRFLREFLLNQEIMQMLFGIEKPLIVAIVVNWIFFALSMSLFIGALLSMNFKHEKQIKIAMKAYLALCYVAVVFCIIHDICLYS